MNIVLFGIQGSGKGTLARAICNKYNLHYFETGAQLRKLSSEETPLGQKVKEVISSGHLVSNEIVMEIIEDFIKTIPTNEGVVFDGIPRKEEQARTFDALMKKIKRTYLGILIDVPKEKALKRLTTRRICSKCKTIYPATYNKDKCEKCGGELITRNDDNPESIKTRFETYFKETMPVIESLKKEEKLIIIDGSPSIPEVEKKIFEVIENILT